MAMEDGLPSVQKQASVVKDDSKKSKLSMSLVALSMLVVMTFVGYHSNGGGSVEKTSSSSSSLTTPGHDADFHRNLMGSNHMPLACNANLDTATCASITSLTLPAAGEPLVIPCGECYEVDTDTTWDMPDGLVIEGKLYVPGTNSFEVSTTHVFVLGLLKIDPPGPLATTTIKFRLYGEDDVIYTAPMAGMKCDTGCDLDNKVIAVLGGQLDIRGYDPDCPSWEKLQGVVVGSSDQIKVSLPAALCWKAGTELLLTSHTRWDTDRQVVTIVHSDPLTGIITVNVPLQGPLISVEDDPTFAVEVASLNRPVVFEDIAGSDPDIGGHFIIHHTTAPQHIEGVEIKKFGQLGRLGRYPLHFHMSGDHPNSIVSKNVIRDSNQRGYVIHQTNQVTLEDNVAHGIVGHCYFLEDGVETGNTFRRNLAAGVMVMDRSISDNQLGRKNDNGAAAFWISNANNAFHGNVAAGGENGYWFDTRGSTLRRTNLIAMEDNEAHSCRATAFRTYNPGWRPTSMNTIKNLKIYRNPAMGGFIHVSQNIRFEGGLFADNGEQGVFISRADNIEFDGTVFIGQSSVNPVYCRNFWDKVGISLHPKAFNEHALNGYYKGTKLTNTVFQNWSDTETQCSPGKSRPLDFNTDDIFVHQFAAPHYFKDVQMDLALTVDACPPSNAPYNLDDIALEVVSDAHQSFSSSGLPGFLVSPKVTTLLPSGSVCSQYNDCLQFCENECLRTVTVRTGDSPMPEDVQMIVTNDVTGASITVDRGTRFGDDVIHRLDAFFGVALPSGSFTASFVKQSTGEVVWPGFVTPVYEAAPECANHIEPGGLTFTLPDIARTECSSSLIYNGDFELGQDGWAQNRDIGLTVASGLGVGGSSAGKTTKWSRSSYWPYQYLDTSCIQDGDVFGVEISYQVVGQEGTECTSGCPKARIWYQDWTPSTARYSYQVTTTIPTTSTFDASTGYNKLSGQWTVSSDEGNASKVMFFIEAGYNLIIDNVVVTKV